MRIAAARPPSPLAIALQACRRAFVFVALFSAAINVLFLTIPLYMMQVFDRVLPSRSAARSWTRPCRRDRTRISLCCPPLLVKDATDCSKPLSAAARPTCTLPSASRRPFVSVEAA